MPDDQAEPLYFTPQAGLTTLIRIQTMPNAACTIHQEGSESPSMLAYADPSGSLDLYVRPMNISNETGKLIVKAELDSNTTQHVLALRPVREQITAVSPSSLLSEWRADNVAIRPALSLDEALQITDLELLERGYPFRPNPQAAPRAFGDWLLSVASFAIRVEPHSIVRPDISHVSDQTVPGSNLTLNWSGFVLEDVTGAYNDAYDWLTGRWIVPHVTGENFHTTYSGIWIGLGGRGNATEYLHMFQTGTGHQNTTFDLWGFKIDVSSYYYWTEIVPRQPTEHQINGFPVHPGDEIYCQLWIGDQYALPSLDGTHGYIYVHNLDTRIYIVGDFFLGSDYILGRSAEWIMERPKDVNGHLPDLANYGSVIMRNPIARDPARNYYYYLQAPYTNLIMVPVGNDPAAPTPLSIAAPIDSATFRFDWQAFH
jgi:hypothetical protein